ncbi:unnamed protein product [Brassica rapa subsp. trilocularis]
MDGEAAKPPSFGDDENTRKRIDACNCSDGEKVAIDQIIGGDDILSNHPGYGMQQPLLSSPLLAEAMQTNIWFQ